MRSWSLLLALAVAVLCAAAVTGAVPIDDVSEQAENAGSRTWTAIKGIFRPFVDYVTKKLPEKTPSEVASDVTDKVSDTKEWIQENKAVQGLVSALVPVKEFFKSHADNLKDKSFKEIFDDVKDKVNQLDHKVGTWLQERSSKAE